MLRNVVFLLLKVEKKTIFFDQKVKKKWRKPEHKMVHDEEKKVAETRAKNAPKDRKKHRKTDF